MHSDDNTSIDANEREHWKMRRSRPVRSPYGYIANTHGPIDCKLYVYARRGVISVHVYEPSRRKHARKSVRPDGETGSSQNVFSTRSDETATNARRPLCYNRSNFFHFTSVNGVLCSCDKSVRSSTNYRPIDRDKEFIVRNRSSASILVRDGALKRLWTNRDCQQWNTLETSETHFQLAVR